MRRPTPIDETLAWWRSALRGEAPQITGDVHCGFYTRRLVKGGPTVPCRIYLEQQIDEATGELIAPEIIRCEVAGAQRDPDEEWLWLCANPITEAQFHFLMADSAWCRENAPRSPEANPEKPVRSSTIPTLF